MTRERITGTEEFAEESGQPSKGVTRLSVARKTAAFVPLVLTAAVLVGRIDLGSDEPDPAPQADSSLIDSSTPSALPGGDFVDRGNDDGDKSDDEKDHNRKRAGDKASESPTAEATSAPPTTATPSSAPSPDPTTPGPTKNPTKGPTKNPSPTANPSPDEAEQICREAGVNPLNLPAMAACIADVLDGG